MPTTRPGFLAIEDITVSATPEGLNELQVLLERFWHVVDRVCVHPPDGAWRSQFDIAVWEIGTNIVCHAYPSPREASGMLGLRLRLFVDRVEARFADQGIAYPIPEQAEPMPSLDNDPFNWPESGFGLPVARAALDQLRYRRTQEQTNCWRLVKRFPSPFCST